MTYHQSVAFREVRRLEGEAANELSYFAGRDTLAKIERIEGLLKQHFGVDWETFEAARRQKVTILSR